MPKKKYPTPPSHVRVTRKRTYEVVHIDEFKNSPETLGECRWEPSQIVLKKGQSNKEEFSTFVHELVHALSFEYDANLTETQVLALERGLMNVITLNKWI